MVQKSTQTIALTEHDENVRALAEQVVTTCSAGERLRICGGGSRSFVGRALGQEARDHASDLARGDTRSLSAISSETLSGVLSYEPSELVLRVGAGMPIRKVQEVLGEEGQCLAFEPHAITEDSATSTSTIGGAIATAMAGASRPWTGAVKDHVLGIGIINGKGGCLQFGGQVMKNVAGYDVSRAMVGSLGCMGLITDVSLKVLPVAQNQVLVQMPCSVAEAFELAMKLDQTMSLRTGFVWFEGLAHIRFAGPLPAINEVLNAHRLAGFVVDHDSIWNELGFMRHSIFSDAYAEPLWRLVSPKYLDIASLLGIDIPVLINWAGAEHFVRVDKTVLAAKQALLRAQGVHCYSYTSDNCYVLDGFSEVLLRLHRNLKQAFDPHNVFNVGRMDEAF